MGKFQGLLAEIAKHAASNDDLARRRFRDGDAAHLRRWLDYGDADKTWKKISKGKQFRKDDDEYRFAVLIIKTVLQLRCDAEKNDTLNETFAALKRRGKRLAPRERKRAVKMLANSEITPEQYAAYVAHIDEFDPVKNPRDLGPLLSVRSDEEGTRQRTLFCRMLSDLLHIATGRWHDGEVAELCEIALDCGDVTIEMVRSARRESTRKRRKQR